MERMEFAGFRDMLLGRIGWFARWITSVLGPKSRIGKRTQLIVSVFWLLV